MAFQLVAYCLNQLCYPVLHLFLVHKKVFSCCLFGNSLPEVTSGKALIIIYHELENDCSGNMYGLFDTHLHSPVISPIPYICTLILLHNSFLYLENRGSIFL
jgi:hypothetical protein